MAGVRTGLISMSEDERGDSREVARDVRGKGWIVGCWERGGRGARELWAYVGLRAWFVRAWRRFWGQMRGLCEIGKSAREGGVEEFGGRGLIKGVTETKQRGGFDDIQMVGDMGCDGGAGRWVQGGVHGEVRGVDGGDQVGKAEGGSGGIEGEGKGEEDGGEGARSYVTGNEGDQYQSQALVEPRQGYS